MSENAQAGQMMAEIDFGRNPYAVVWVGQRPLHHFWTMLAPYFRGVLVAPQRRSDGSVVTWHWREHAKATAVTPAELAGLRKRLTGDEQAFADNLAREKAGGALPVQGKLDTVMRETIERLVALPEAELATFVCRTEAGLRLHSWSAFVAAAPRPSEEKGGEENAEVKPAEKPTPSDEAKAPAEVSARRWRIAAMVMGGFLVAGGGWWWRSAAHTVPREAKSEPEVAVGKTGAPQEKPAKVAKTRPEDPRPEARGSGGAGAGTSGGGGGASGGARMSLGTGRDAAGGKLADEMKTLRVEPGESDLAREIVVPGGNGAGVAANGTPLGDAAGIGAAGLSPMGNVEAASKPAGNPTHQETAPGTTQSVQSTTSTTEHPEQTLEQKKTAKLRRAEPSADAADPKVEKKKAVDIKPTPKPEDKSRESEHRDPAETPEERKRDTAETRAAEAAPAGEAKVEATPAESESKTIEVSSGPAAPRRAVARKASDSSEAEAPNATASTAATREDNSDGAGGTATGTRTIGWAQTVRLRVLPWRERLMAETILPTMPVPVGSKEDKQALLREVLQTKGAERPATLQRPVMRAGMSFELGEEKAEVTWREEAPEIEAISTVRTESGRRLAEVRRAVNGEIGVSLADGVTARYWMAIEPARPDAALADGSPRFRWLRGVNGGRAGANGMRFEAVLSPREAVVPVQFATVKDVVTGWARTAEVRMWAEDRVR